MIVAGSTIFWSAFLLFVVQPLVARKMLPWFGGSAARSFKGTVNVFVEPDDLVDREKVKPHGEHEPPSIPAATVVFHRAGLSQE